MADDSILPQQLQEAEVPATQYEGEAEEQGGFIPLILQSFHVEVQQALQQELLPRARAINQQIEMIGRAAQEAADQSTQELDEAQAELSRLSSLITSFQAAVCAVLTGMQA